MAQGVAQPQAAKAADPFAAWREQQRQLEPDTGPPPVLELNPARQARLDLVIIDFVDAALAGDEQAAARLGEEMVALQHRLHAEQLAELGYIPPTVDGCIAVLNVAARIIEIYGDPA